MRAFATLLYELIECAETASTGRSLRVLVSIDEHDGFLIIAVATEGRLNPTLLSRGSRALMRAVAIIKALGGHLVRDVRQGRMLFGISFHPAIARAIAEKH